MVTRQYNYRQQGLLAYTFVVPEDRESNQRLSQSTFWSKNEKRDIWIGLFFHFCPLHVPKKCVIASHWWKIVSFSNFLQHCSSRCAKISISNIPFTILTQVFLHQWFWSLPFLWRPDKIVFNKYLSSKEVKAVFQSPVSWQLSRWCPEMMQF